MRLSTRFVFLAMTALTVSAVCAQDLRAVVEDGRKVILLPNGKWRFDASAARTKPPAPGGMLTYQPSAKKFSVAYSGDTWELMQVKDSDSASKRAFAHKTLPMYAMVIADEIPVSTAAVKNVILANARAGGAEPTVLLDKPVDIGGNAAGNIRFAVAHKGVEFEFVAYYFGSPDGNVQVSCYTAQSLFAKYENECKKFLDGLVIK